MLPLAVPGLVLAFGYIAMSLRWPFGKGDPLEGWVDIVGANPNPFPLPVKSIRYSVQLGERRFASGETQGTFNVPASGEGSFAISVDMDMLQQTSQLSSLLRGGIRQ